MQPRQCGHRFQALYSCRSQCSHLSWGSSAETDPPQVLDECESGDHGVIDPSKIVTPLLAKPNSLSRRTAAEFNVSHRSQSVSQMRQSQVGALHRIHFNLDQRTQLGQIGQTLVSHIRGADVDPSQQGNRSHLEQRTAGK